MKKKEKRYILVVVVAVLVGVLIWQLSSSYATVTQGYSGKNIISGDKWGINITKVGEIQKEVNAEVKGDISGNKDYDNIAAVLDEITETCNSLLYKSQLK